MDFSIIEKTFWHTLCPYLVTMKVYISIIIGFFLSTGLTNAQNYSITDTTGKVIFQLAGDQLTDQNDNVRLTVKGNIIFEGNSTNKRDIFLLAKVQDVFGKKTDYIYDKALKIEMYAVEKGAFFIDGDASDIVYLAIVVKKNTDGTTQFLYGQTDDVLLTVDGDSLQTGQITAIVHLTIEHFQLREALAPNIRAYAVENNSVGNSSGTIRKMWGQAQTEFIWNGETIKPKWGQSDLLEWKYDGYTLERVWYGDADAFEWDGRILKRKWYNSQEEFEVIGNTIRPRFGGFGEEYIIQGNIIKNPWNPGTEDEWELSGDVPLPIIVLVLFGLISR